MSLVYSNAVEGRQLLYQRSKQRAYVCLSKHEYNRAFAHFLIALSIERNAEEDLVDMFLCTLEILCSELEVKENWQELFICYEKALEILPYHARVSHGLATILFRLGHMESALMYFHKAFMENPFYSPSLYCIDGIKSVLVERWHFPMLNDKDRNSSYAEAIRKAVKRGCTSVLDIGAGTGIFSMIAVDAGAKNVYACEGNEVMVPVLQNVIEANQKSVKILEKFSTDIIIPDDLPEKVDLVVTEIFDAALFGEGSLKTLKHAWDCVIKAAEEVSGLENLSITDDQSDERRSTVGMTDMKKIKVIPLSATLWAVPLECERLKAQSRACRGAMEELGLFNCSLCSLPTDENPYSTEKLSSINDGFKYLSNPQVMLTVNFNDVAELDSLMRGKTFEVVFSCTADGHLDAFAVWFDLQLDDEISLSTAPKNKTCWEQAIFYTSSACEDESSEFVDVGESLKAVFHCSDHIRLRSITNTTKTSIAIPRKYLDSSVVQQLNLLYASGILSHDLFSDISSVDLPVLDISSIPLIGLKALKDGAKKLITLPSKHLMDFHLLLDSFNISADKFRVMSFEDICTESFSCNLLITEPVEICGLLKKNTFENIALLRSICSKELLKVFPNKMRLYAVLVDSADLCARSRIVSDECCMGYKVSEFLNAYQCTMHQDIDLSTTDHSKLTDAVMLGCIELDNLCLERNKLQSFVEFSGSLKVSAVESGSISAIPYWFELVYNSSCIVDTLNPKTLWKQAAVIPETKLSVAKDDSIEIKWSCRNSCLHISVEKC